MVNRYQTTRISIAIAMFFLATMVAVAIAQVSNNIGPAQGRKITLQQQLTVGLKAFTRADREFISRVVAAVEQGRLPRTLVDSTFLWARNRAERRSYTRSLRPMVYFQPGMILRARRFGLRL